MSDPTPAELARILVDTRTSLRERVHRETYDADQRRVWDELARVKKDNADLEAEIAGRDKERKADRRVMYGAVAAAAATIVIDIYQSTQGVT